MKKEKSGRPVAVVTGGSRGIGRAVCVKLAQDGMDIVFSFVSGEEAAAETARLCEEAGAVARKVKADVRTEEGAAALFAEADEAFGRVDVLVNNAGITRDGLAVRMSEADFDAVIATNLKGTFLCAKEAGKRMMRARTGRIINMSSVVGLHGNAGQINYAASKAGVIGLTKSLAKELAGRGVTVNAIAPGFIATDMTAAMPEAAKEAALSQIPAGKLGCAEDVANAVSFLAKAQSGYITGQVLAVDGGMSM